MIAVETGIDSYRLAQLRVLGAELSVRRPYEASRSRDEPVADLQFDADGDILVLTDDVAAHREEPCPCAAGNVLRAAVQDILREVLHAAPGERKARLEG